MIARAAMTQMASLCANMTVAQSAEYICLAVRKLYSSLSFLAVENITRILAHRIACVSSNSLVLWGIQPLPVVRHSEPLSFRFRSTPPIHRLDTRDLKLVP